MKLTLTRLLSLLLLTYGVANAAPILGSLWTVPDGVAQIAVLASVPGTSPDVTFQVNSPINFNIGGPNSVSVFLASGGAMNISGSAAQLSRLISDGTTSSLIEFTGLVSVTNGQQFTVTHDDGLTLIIGGVNVIGVTGPTPPIQTTATYTGPSGNLPFTLVYGECCAGSAVLQISLPFQPAPSGVPEPTTFVMLASSLGLAAAVRRVFCRR